MDATTIKIYPDTKRNLDDFKEDEESYDLVINKLISEVRNKHLVNELIEAYSKKAKEDKQIGKEWDNISPDWD